MVSPEEVLKEIESVIDFLCDCSCELFDCRRCASLRSLYSIKDSILKQMGDEGPNLGEV